MILVLHLYLILILFLSFISRYDILEQECYYQESLYNNPS